MKLNKILFALFLFWPWLLQAKLNFWAELSDKSITLEDEATIVVTLEGESASDPVAPQVPGLDILQTGRQSQFVFSNGTSQSLVKFHYTLIPSDKGTYTIPPFIAYAQGKEYKSNALTLEVTPGNFPTQKPSSLPLDLSPTTDPRDKKIQDQIKNSNPQNQDQELFWIATQVSNSTPFVSEPILYQFKFFSRVNVNLDEIKLPNFENFYAEVVVPEKKGQETVEGHVYTTYQIVYSLIPLEPKQVVLEEARLGLSYLDLNQAPSSRLWDPFARMGKTVKKNLRSSPLEIDVKPLPQPKPNDFSDLVGTFDFESTLSKDEITLGETSSLKIKIEGFGNLNQFSLPQWSVPNLKIYQDNPTLKTEVGSLGIKTSKEFTLALVPTAASEIKLKDLKINYFDTQSKTYEVFTLPDLTLNVLPLAGSNQQMPVFATDLATPPDVSNNTFVFDFNPDPKAAFNAAPKAFDIKNVIWLSLLWPFLVWLVFIVVSRLKSGENDWFKSKPKQKLLKSINALSQKPVVTPLEMSAFIKKVLSSVLNQNVTAQTAEEIRRLSLSQSNASVPFQSLLTQLEWLEEQLYGKQASPLDSKKRNEILKWLKSILMLLAFVVLLPFNSVKASASSEDKFLERYQMIQGTLESGRAEEALNSLNPLIDDYPHRPHLHFDAAQLYHQLNQLGWARYHYELALEGLPLNASLKHKYKQLLQQIDESKPSTLFDVLSQTFYFWIEYFSLYHLQCLSLVFSFIFSILIVYKKSKGHKLFWPVGFCFALTLCYFLAATYVKYKSYSPNDNAIVVSKTVTVQSSFLNKADTVFELREGYKVVVLNEHTDSASQKWYRIEWQPGRMGWVKAQDVAFKEAD